MNDPMNESDVKNMETIVGQAATAHKLDAKLNNCHELNPPGTMDCLKAILAAPTPDALQSALDDALLIIEANRLESPNTP